MPERAGPAEAPVALGVLRPGQPFGQLLRAELLLDGVDRAQHRAGGGALGGGGLGRERACDRECERPGQQRRAESVAHGNASLELGRAVAYPPPATESKVSGTTLHCGGTEYETHRRSGPSPCRGLLRRESR